ncbi:MAG: hypothetical protein ABSC22_19030 [Roseiarcus sp.]|jgi:hypothetical protein
MMRVAGTAFLACLLSLSGDALAGPPRHSGPPPRHCHWGQIEYDASNYCVSGRGIVEMCMNDGTWLSIGACQGSVCGKRC